MQSRLTAHLQQVTRLRDPYFATEGYFYVQHYIREQLGLWGKVEVDEFVDGLRPGFAHRGRSHYNYVLDLPGRSSDIAPRPSQERQPPILIGAHYDAIPGTPGADDNATGIAVLLEFARLFSLAPARHPIRLVAFDLEEYGALGSQHYAQRLRQQRQALRLMLSLEMLGYCDRTPHSQRYPPGLDRFYPHRGDFIALVGNLKTIPDLIALSRRVDRDGVPCWWLPAGNRGLIVPDTRRSDHAAFWDAGYGAVMVTDTAHLRNPHYHRSSDRLETLDLQFLTGICRGLAQGIRHL